MIRGYRDPDGGLDRRSVERRRTSAEGARYRGLARVEVIGAATAVRAWGANAAGALEEAAVVASAGAPRRRPLLAGEGDAVRAARGAEVVVQAVRDPSPLKN